MSETGISAAATDFINRHIEAVEQLEVLLLLRRHSGRVWDAAQVAAELRIDAGSAGRRLQDLAARELLTVDEASGGYRYVRSNRDDLAIADVERAYNERPVTLISLIFSKPSDSIRLFSDAFKLRKKDE